MKILYMAFDAKNYALRICNEIAKQGHEITVFVLKKDFFDNTCKIKMEDNIEVIELDESDFFDDDKFMKTYIDKIKNADFDVIFGVTIIITQMVHYLGRKLNIPKIMMLLDIPIHLIEKQKERKKGWEICKPLLLNMDNIIFNTIIARDEFSKMFGKNFPEKNILTYPTYLPKKYYKSGIDIDGDYVISVCRLNSEKNCLIIPYALSKLKVLNKYVAIGKDGGQLNKIKKTCKQFNIEFIHYSNITDDKKFELIKNSSILIYPQNTEYIGGLPPFEGMFVGKPVITTDFPVLKNLYGNKCSYFKNNNIDSLSVQIGVLSSLKRTIFKTQLESAAEETQKDASFKKIADGIINILEETK